MSENKEVITNGKTRFFLKHMKDTVPIELPDVPTHFSFLIESLKKNFPNMSHYPNDVFYFEIKDKEYNVDYRLEELGDIYDTAVVEFHIIKEKVPLDILLGEIADCDIVAPSEASKTIKVRGLPWESDENDIVNFFSGLEVKPHGVFISYNKANIRRHNGDAFVEFTSEDSVEQALKKHREVMNSRYVEIQRVKEKDLFNLKRHLFECSFNEESSVPVDENSLLLKLTGLPWETTYSDIRNLLEDIPLTAIHFPKDKLGRALGIAYVEIADEEFFSRAMGHQREYIGKRFIELRKAKMRDLIRDMITGSDGSTPVVEEKSTYCISIRNLPSELSNFAIDRFFTQESISPYRIHKKVNGTEAYCEFTNEQDFRKALMKNGSFIEQNRLDISEVSYEEVANKVGLKRNK